MRKMLQTRPWDFMVKYTPHREWVEGHGIMIAFALFFGGIAGGLYLASLYFNNLLGMFIAMLMAMVTGITDLAHLSKPTRAWRMAFRPQSSWIARGFIFITLFIGASAIQLALSWWAPGAAETFFKVVAAILAVCVAIYSGFVLAYVGGIKLWNSAIVPILFVVAGITGGCAVLLLISYGETAARLLAIGRLALLAVGAYAVALLVYIWGTSYGSAGARYSVGRMLKGDVAWVFWLVVVVIGILIPVVLMSPFVAAGAASAVAFTTAAVCVIIGGIGLRYSILKAGVYNPLLPTE
ncbi:MAG: polysulfide reductase NrfD [Dehalococcoidales bacterium]|nr:polysulfide reductase NrfD [Dehalococcoidales bacterium]